jgi:hypothetical protein
MWEVDAFLRSVGRHTLTRVRARHLYSYGSLISSFVRHWKNYCLVSGLVLILGLGCSRAAAAGIGFDVQVSHDQNSASYTVTSPIFTTKDSGELLLAFISADQLSSPNTTVQNVSGADLAWTLVVRTNSQAGTSEIWRAFAPGLLNDVTVSAALSQSVVSSITVMSFTGVNSSGTGGSGAIGAKGSGNAASGAPIADLVTTQGNSLVVGVGNDFDYAIARFPAAGQSLVHQDFSSTQDTYWVQKLDAVTSLKGSEVKLADISPISDEYNLSICEILPAVATVAELTSSVSSLAFGDVTDGDSKTLPLTLTSTGTASATINSAAIAGTGFALATSDLPITLPPGSSLTLQAEFSPKAAGSDTGQITIDTNAATGAKLTVGLAGTAVASTDPQLTLSPANISFGSVTVGSGVIRSFTLTSAGTSPVTVSADAISGSGFSILNGTLPATLNPNQTLAINVQFLPSTVGAASGSFTIDSNSTTGSKSTATLTGTGAALAHSVSLSWNAPSGSPDPVAGYHIYRALGTGSYALIDSALDTQTTYLDKDVVAGDTYEYEVKSVDAQGVESIPSDSITVTIP